ncbi:MAG: hypothetical protein U9Q33_06585 [Campylobacterota bacterium]|nr:hypothetical protein [Campylobacterota bacterium]
MIEFKDKNIFFSARGEKIEKEELVRYFIQNEAVMVDTVEEASMIIQGYMTPVHLEDRFYLLSKEGIEVVSIEDIEKQFSTHLDIDSIIMAIKISKDKQRLTKLLRNKYFSDEIFVTLLKYYDWEGEGLHDTDENRDISTQIVSRFCTLQESNHNIQHSPIGVYYTALETTNGKLLESIFNMPNYSISDKNAKENQPLTLKEVTALNPNTPKPVLIQILKNKNKDELKFLALNQSINKMISNKLFDLNETTIKTNLIISGNISTENLKDALKDEDLKNKALKYIPLSNERFDTLVSQELTPVQIVYLSSNNTLNKEQITYLTKLNIENANINLLKNSECPKEIIEKFFHMNDLVYNIAISHNENLEAKKYQTLYELEDLNIDISLGYNTSTPQEILKKLYEKDDENINLSLAQNTNTPINILMQIQIDSRYNSLVSNNETYKEFSRNNLGIIQDRNSRFKRAVYDQADDFWD